MERVALVGALGRTNKPELRGFDRSTSLRRPAIRELVATGAVRSALFGQCDLAEITNPDYLGQRPLSWRNPATAHEHARRREESLQAAEVRLEMIAAARRREQAPLRGADQPGLRVGMAIRQRKAATHYELRIGEREFSFACKPATIAAEAELDGLYAIRTSLAAGDLSAPEVVRAHQRLGPVEQALCNYQSSDRTADPAGDRSAKRLRAQALLCMLAYQVEWHMRVNLAPLLSADQGPSASAAKRSSRASKGKAKERPRHSFRSLLENLSTITRNRIEPHVEGVQRFEMLTRPRELQGRAFDLLGVEFESAQ